MANLQPFITNIKGTRRFACSAVALQAVVVNPEEKVLLLSSPSRQAGFVKAAGRAPAGNASR